MPEELCKWCRYCKDLTLGRHPPHKEKLNDICSCVNHSKSTNELILIFNNTRL